MTAPVDVPVDVPVDAPMDASVREPAPGRTPGAAQLARRSILVGSACGVAVAAAASARAGQAARRSPRPLVLDDASRLNPTPVARHLLIRPDEDAALLARLRAELRDAAAAGRPVAVGAARHSMGGQSLARSGTALTFAAGEGCVPDRAAGVFRVRAGARWRDVIASLDPLGLSPAVMQSNNDFGVGSTFCVNAHGWPVPHGPFGTTVRSLRLMLADGTVVTCSPRENAELFALAMGGYGLVGVVLGLDAEMVPNRQLAPGFEVLPAASFAQAFVRHCTDPAVAMAYGRLDVSARNFLGEALLVAYRPLPGQTPSPAGTGGVVSAVSREVYRAQTGSERGKRFRWYVETNVGPRMHGSASRNALLNEPVSNLAGHDVRRTDILHEYFLPPGRLAEFLSACREVVPQSRQELLNVTLRYVGPDDASVLAYAPGPRVAAVMSFSQAMTPAADADMRRMTQDLVDRVLPLDGSFYLPYRLHARRDQVRRAYPALERFADLKRRYDPGLLFRNALWDTWLADPVPTRGAA